MASDPTFRQWAETHPRAAVLRVVSRLDRFANNTSNEETSLAAQDLVAKLKEATPDAAKTEDDS